MTGEHILITGATGLVGRSAMQHYAEKGYKVTAVLIHSMSGARGICTCVHRADGWETKYMVRAWCGLQHNATTRRS